MKKFSRKLQAMLLLSLLAVFTNPSAHGQIFKKLKEAVKQSASQTAQDSASVDAGNSTSKVIGKAGGAIGGLFKKGNKNKTDSKVTTATVVTADNTNGAMASTAPQSIVTYQNYDFVPGDQIIFQSNMAADQQGSLPSQYIVNEGQLDVQTVDGENVIHVPTGSGANFSPRMRTANYLPKQFTVEFDVKNEKAGLEHVKLTFGDAEGTIADLNLGYDNTNWGGGNVIPPEALQLNSDYPMQWHHIAIAVNENQGKIYIDQSRVVNVNNLTGNAKAIIFNIDGYENSFIKNIRIASGGIDIDKKITTDGKIIMHGILFDVDKATLQPASMGSINQIYALLKKDPSLKFEIDGHTDNTGDAAHNMILSQQRANAVASQLESMGIEASRFTSKGFGDSVPISDNTTPEGRANNRRVEFLKM